MTVLSQRPYSSDQFMPSTAIRWGVPAALAAVGVTAVAAYVITAAQLLVAPDLAYPIAFVGDILGYGATLGIASLSSRIRGLGSFREDFGLSFRRIDIAFGLAIALGNILLIALVANVLKGAGALPPAATQSQTPIIWVVLLQGVIPVLVAPIAEEIVARGLVMRSIRQLILRRSRVPAANAQLAINASIIVSAVIFAALHLHEAHDLSSAISKTAQTLIFGLVAGWIATRTGRLGPSIAAHTVFNAILFAIALAARH